MKFSSPSRWAVVICGTRSPVRTLIVPSDMSTWTLNVAALDPLTRSVIWMLISRMLCGVAVFSREKAIFMLLVLGDGANRKVPDKPAGDFHHNEMCGRQCLRRDRLDCVARADGGHQLDHGLVQIGLVQQEHGNRRRCGCLGDVGFGHRGRHSDADVAVACDSHPLRQRSARAGHCQKTHMRWGIPNTKYVVSPNVQLSYLNKSTSVMTPESICAQRFFTVYRQGRCQCTYCSF